MASKAASKGSKAASKGGRRTVHRDPEVAVEQEAGVSTTSTAPTFNPQPDPPVTEEEHEEEEHEEEEHEEEEHEEEEHEEEEHAPDTTTAATSDTTTAATSKKQQHGRSRKTAEKRLQNAIKRVEPFPWEGWGIPGIVAGLALLKTGLQALQAIPKGTRIGAPAPVREGSTVRVKDQYRDKYVDLVGEQSLSNLKVTGIRKSSAMCVAANSEKLMFPLREIETDATPPDTNSSEAL